jgi:hypothetical protein
MIQRFFQRHQKTQLLQISVSKQASDTLREELENRFPDAMSFQQQPGAFHQVVKEFFCFRDGHLRVAIERNTSDALREATVELIQSRTVCYK